MATYKKRGYKPKKEKAVNEVEETYDETQSTTAEVFNNLDEAANKSEQWIENLFTFFVYFFSAYMEF